MILAIDIGNTNLTIGCFDGEQICFAERLSTDLTRTDLEYAVSIKTILELYGIKESRIRGGIISSVVPPLTKVIAQAAKKVIHRQIKVVGPGVKTGLNIHMDQPAQVGSDRIVNAVAAIEAYEAPIIVVDLGTATTISLIDEKKNYAGGMILPGVATALEALTERTSQLPKISIEQPRKAIGKNTVDCMKSGIIYGSAACIDGMIDRIEDEIGQKASLVATGGLAGTIIPHCKKEIPIDETLLLKGLQLIYNRNDEKN